MGIRYAISDRHLLDGGVEAIARWAAAAASTGVEYLQLREKDLSAGKLMKVALAVRAALVGSSTRLLINARIDVAVAAKAAGVHLTAGAEELTAMQVRLVYADAGLGPPFVTASCHTLAEITRRREEAADALLFGPVFSKTLAGRLVVEGLGLGSLRAACAAARGVPVLALGGVTADNIAECRQAGAAGVAGIRLFGASSNGTAALDLQPPDA